MDKTLVQAIELADSGDWDGAHKIVQNESGQNACWLHANLHREEGDLSNAQYWYGRAGIPKSEKSIADERTEIKEAIS
jgi:hypothetical protein